MFQDERRGREGLKRIIQGLHKFLPNHHDKFKEIKKLKKNKLEQMLKKNIF